MLRTVSYRDYTRIIEILVIIAAVVITSLVAGLLAGMILLGLILAVLLTYAMTTGAWVGRKLRQIRHAQSEPVTRQLLIAGPEGEILSGQVISEEGEEGYRVVLTSSGMMLVNPDYVTVERLA